MYVQVQVLFVKCEVEVSLGFFGLCKETNPIAGKWSKRYRKQNLVNFLVDSTAPCSQYTMISPLFEDSDLDSLR